MCGKHFISGKAAKLSDRHDPDWVPTQNLGHNKCDSAQEIQVELEAAAKQDEKARDCELKRVAAERERWLREEIESKKQKIDEPGQKIIDIAFDIDSAMELETDSANTVKPPFNETYFTNDDAKVRFYMGSPAYDVLQTVYQNVSTFVVRKSPTLS